MKSNTKAGIASIGSLFLMVMPAAAVSSSPPASTSAGGVTTFCCNSYDNYNAIGRSCTVAPYSPAVVNACANISFSCGTRSFVECLPSATMKSGGYGQQLQDCACFSFAE
jgi:hypothetical protein